MEIQVIKRSGEVVAFDSERIKRAIQKAIHAIGKSVPQDISQEKLDVVYDSIFKEISDRFTDLFPNVENIQDIVEKNLVSSGLYEVAKEYILYRAKRSLQREQEKKIRAELSLLGKMTVKKRNGTSVMFDVKKLKAALIRARQGSEKIITDTIIDKLIKEIVKNVYDGVTTADLEQTAILSSTMFIEKDPVYNLFTTKLFLQKLYKEVIGRSTNPKEHDEAYRASFKRNINRAVDIGTLNSQMLDYNLDTLSKALKPERDGLFRYIGIKTLYERYFIAHNDQRLELPQSFLMRVAMGLALNEKNKEQVVISFYEAMSTLRYIPSTPTLFHSGLNRPQLSSLLLTTIKDDLGHIFKCMGDNAQFSKWSGGIGNDWTYARATGAHINSTGVESQGSIPFLKIANDVTAAINRSGKRRGATCAYMEVWHLDFEDFIDLRRNTGDERRRTHDMNIAAWIPDLFMKRVLTDENWTMFSPDEVIELHDLFGAAFEKKYIEYEEKACNGKIQKHKVVSAKQLWRKMLTRLFETGHPWLTWKDPCNIRSPQDHVGIVHSSNLCTEITLNTSFEETAVCNLGSINLATHIINGKLDTVQLAATTEIAIRMLDNVIDLNFYPTIEAKNSNMKHRPIGLGIMGFADLLFKLDLAFESDEALQLADLIQEAISYHAIFSSSKLAKERGVYGSFKGSKWDRGIFPLDTLTLLEQERGMPIVVNRDETMDWTTVREFVKKNGMRNSNIMAIAPTATIANITGVFPSIEPIYKNIYVKANVSGEFTVVNTYLIDDLKALGLWNEEMLEQLKYYDGSVQRIVAIPEKLRLKYKESFEISPKRALLMTAVRGKWIDQSQSHNVFLATTSGPILHDTYVTAWQLGLKTTYYLRSLGKSQVEKSTLDAGKFGFTQKRQYTENSGNISDASAAVVPVTGVVGGVAPKKLCAILDPECEACQ